MLEVVQLGDLVLGAILDLSPKRPSVRASQRAALFCCVVQDTIRGGQVLAVGQSGTPIVEPVFVALPRWRCQPRHPDDWVRGEVGPAWLPSTC